MDGSVMFSNKTNFNILGERLFRLIVKNTM